jgi:threonine synthase
MLIHKESGKISEGSKNVVLLTGSGLKDIKSLEQEIKIPEAIEPDINNTEHR